MPGIFSGERGIRTPGSVDTEQRFSRPPHSTALPSLRLLMRLTEKLMQIAPVIIREQT